MTLRYSRVLKQGDFRLHSKFASMNNRLLTSLDPSDVEAIGPYLFDVDLPLRQVLDEAHYVYFVESGLLSLITVAGPSRIEIGVIGVEGLVGVPAILGSDTILHETVVQIAGKGKRIAIPDLRRCMAASSRLTSTLLRFAHVTLAQISHTALANGRNTVEQRLARWLLMAHDRLIGNDIALTHEFLAVMLGVRRPGVTVALHMLEGVHAIRSRRNLITVVDRDKLKQVAGPSYGPPEALYEHLFGRPVDAAAA